MNYLRLLGNILPDKVIKLRQSKLVKETFFKRKTLTSETRDLKTYTRNQVGKKKKKMRNI